MSAMCFWRLDRSGHPATFRWDLVVRKQSWWRTREVVVANAWSNGIWHTFDENGNGGENDVEPHCNWKRAKIEAAASAIEQGFI